ncbi:MAG: hypothetical protein ACLPVF_11825 [Acidimicrobiales bacterium]
MIRFTAPSEDAFASTVLRGLLDLGPTDPREKDLALELGLSLWLRRCDTSVGDARVVLLDLRDAVIDASGLDPEFEPIPLVGRSLEADLVNLTDYLGRLVPRAANAAQCAPRAMVERTIELLAGESAHRPPERVAG